MAIKKYIFILIFCFFNILLFSKNSDEDMKNYSNSLGLIIGKNLKDLNTDVDINEVIKGIKKSNNKNLLISNENALLTFNKLQKKIYSKISKKNLLEAEEFLLENKKNKKIIQLEDNKIQYKLINEGIGNKIAVYNNPLIKYKAYDLKGNTILESEEIIYLNETFDGMKKALLDMKEKEKRVFYFHPSKVFKDTFPLYNSLVIFEIEILDIDSSNINHCLPLEIANKIKNCKMYENYTF